jgi:hypothetical protein
MNAPDQGEPFDWPGRGVAEPRFRGLSGMFSDWRAPDGALLMLRATGWRAQRKNWTTHTKRTAAEAIAELDRLEGR